MRRALAFQAIDQNGPEGVLRKKLIVAASRGGFYGPAAPAPNHWLALGPINAGARPGKSKGEATTGSATGPNNVEKLADRLVLAFSVRAQLPMPLQAPAQPASPQPLAGEAVNVTSVPALKLALQVEPQSIPVGALVALGAAGRPARHWLCAANRRRRCRPNDAGTL